MLNDSASSHPDLFWAIRGGGANYGIVTRWEYEAAPYPELVSYGSLEWGPSAKNLTRLLQAFNRWQPWLLPEDVARVHIAMFWDEVMLEVYCWCPEQQMQQLLATFPYAQAGLPAPNLIVLRSWNYSAYMLSSSVTNCYGAAQWGWENISSTAAVTQAEHAWREAHTQGSWRFHGGSAVFMGAISDDQLANFSTIAMDRISNPKSFTRAVMVAAGGVQRRMASNATGFGYRMMTQQLEIGTQARDAKDAAWVDAVLEALMPSSKGQRFCNHHENDFQCLGEEQKPWKSYFGYNAALLLVIKAQYDPQQRINGMSCAALNR
uniref:Berberine/berberine-like domain-containing protein n=1 Tax=Tetradesmus obliquus TaxID=3088 RepID=A0A383VBB1_TETOB|eukprot:jgi/Sobl393_1/2131/SZX62855.1